jgi:hypothetical protein
MAENSPASAVNITPIHGSSRRSGRHPEFFAGRGGADPETIYNLCLILKIML